MRVKLALAAVLAVAGAVSSAHAGLVFSDNFDAGAAQPNWPGDAVFTSMPAPVPGDSNQRGNLLDNVVVTSSVPEASTWMMMVAGFIGLGFAGYRARKGTRVTQLG